jgi:hypothetical protein
MKHYHVSYVTTVGTLKNVKASTKVYAETAEAANAKVMGWSAVSKIVQSYDLGD